MRKCVKIPLVPWGEGGCTLKGKGEGRRGINAWGRVCTLKGRGMLTAVVCCECIPLICRIVDVLYN